MRSDPFIAAADRRGQSFQSTKWHTEKPTPQHPPPERLARARAREAAPKSVFERFKQRVIQRCGAGGIHALGRSFRIMDDNRNGILSFEELQTGLNDYGLRLHDDEVDELIAAIDKDGAGRINYDEFLLAVRGDINPRRRKMIEMAYNVLDRDGSGLVTVDDIAGRYSINYDPDVLTGRMTEESCLERFLGQFEGVEKDGCVTRDEFIEYYKNCSASIDDDDYFELMIRNAWHIPGGEGWCANTSNTRVLVVLSDGTQKVVCIEHDLGLDLNDHDAVMSELRRQGLNSVVKYTRGMDV